MNPLYIPVALISGVALAIIFYGGLWVTVRNLPTARHPVWLTLCSFWIRMLVVIVSLLVVMRGNWQYALACLGGFVIGRIGLSRYLVQRGAGTKCP